MARPRKSRRLCEVPRVLGFRPYGDCVGSVELSFDEYEAFRLIDALKLSQEECANQMKVARSTVASIYKSAREKIADAVVSGKEISFRAGGVELCQYHSECCGRCGQRDCASCGQCAKGRKNS